MILKRQVKRPPLSNSDRIRLVLLSHFTKFWKPTLHIIQPDTLLRWHRNLFRNYWRRKSQGRPRVGSETITLTRKIVKENKLWGAERRRGELLKLGIELSKRAVQKYMPKEMNEPASSQTWATFLKNQANEVCERFMGSLRRECLDPMLIHDGKHVQRAVQEYTVYYNQERPHQGISQRIPEQFD